MTDFVPLVCDEIAADTLKVQEFVKRKYSLRSYRTVYPETIESLVVDAERAYRARIEDPIRHALDIHEPFESDLDREVYERILKAVIGRRIGYRIKMNKAHGKDAPFAPR